VVVVDAPDVDPEVVEVELPVDDVLVLECLELPVVAAAVDPGISVATRDPITAAATAAPPVAAAVMRRTLRRAAFLCCGDTTQGCEVASAGLGFARSFGLVTHKEHRVGLATHPV
jgi:hypothetical protein